MEDKKLNGHLSESLRRKLENFPEEFPSENEWQQIRSRMLEEGLLRRKSYRKRYLLLFLLMLCISVLVSVPFLVKREAGTVRHVSSRTETNKTAENNVTQKKSNDENKLVKNEELKSAYKEKTKQEKSAERTGKTEKEFNNPVVKHSAGEKNKISPATKKKEEGFAVTAKQKNLNEKNVYENSTSANREIGIKSDVSNEKNINASVEVVPTADSLQVNNISDTLVKNDSVVAAQPDANKDSTATNIVSENKTTTKPLSSKKIRLGFFVSWDSNKYYLKENSNAEQAEVNYILNSDSIGGQKSSVQFTVGIRGDYFISGRTAIEAGIFYSQQRRVDAVIYTPQYSSASGNSVSDFTYYLNAKYLEVDGRIKYYVKQQKPSVYISAGAKGSLNLEKGNPDYFEHTIYSESAVPRTERVLIKPASMGFNLVLAAGGEFSLSSRYSFFIEPSYIYALDPVINNPEYISVPVNLYRRGFSFGTGLIYKF